MLLPLHLLLTALICRCLAKHFSLQRHFLFRGTLSKETYLQRHFLFGISWIYNIYLIPGIGCGLGVTLNLLLRYTNSPY
jgi:hypothetical protein